MKRERKWKTKRACGYIGGGGGGGGDRRAAAVAGRGRRVVSGVGGVVGVRGGTGCVKVVRGLTWFAQRGVVVGVEKDDHADVSSSGRPEGGVPGGGRRRKSL